MIIVKEVREPVKIEILMVDGEIVAVHSTTDISYKVSVEEGDKNPYKDKTYEADYVGKLEW